MPRRPDNAPPAVAPLARRLVVDPTGLPAVETRALAAFCAGLAVWSLAAGCFGARLERQREWVEMYPEAPREIKRAVLGKKLVQGMPPDAVCASWGEPDDVVDLGGGDARWTYNRRQEMDGVAVNVEYTLVFNRSVLIRVHRQKYR